jgi:NAD(P)-dependent dehydrogenase (short-subunit alcohol dehydrogenase family)
MEVEMTNQFDLSGRVGIVTGASSGLGARFATVLAGAGATVLAAGRRTDRLEQLAINSPGIQPVSCDVTDSDQRSALVAEALAGHGRLDFLINNAGISVEGPAVDEGLDDFQRVIDVNVLSVFALSQLAGRAMLEARSGTIINVASIYGLVASSPVQQASYCASKGAMVNLTRELAVQWASGGVRVNAIAPGWFPSELTSEMFKNERSMAWLTRNTPMRRPGDPHELDGVVLLLTSDASTYLTGQVIVVDGGWTAR